MMPMWDRFRNSWLPRVLFIATLAVAAALIVAVVVCPWLPLQHDRWPLVGLFAADVTVRRTAIASAVALIVTAFVFFRPATSPPKKKPSPKEPTSGNMAGA